MFRRGSLLVIGGALVLVAVVTVAASSMYAWLNLTTGVGPGGGHAGFGNPIPAIPFAVWPADGCVAVALVLVVLAGLRRSRG